MVEVEEDDLLPGALERVGEEERAQHERRVARVDASEQPTVDTGRQVAQEPGLERLAAELLPGAEHERLQRRVRLVALKPLGEHPRLGEHERGDDGDEPHSAAREATTA